MRRGSGAVRWDFSRAGDQAIKLALRRRWQFAVGLFLQLVGQAAAQQVGAKGGRRIAAKFAAPARAQHGNGRLRQLRKLARDLVGDGAFGRHRTGTSST